MVGWGVGRGCGGMEASAHHELPSKESMKKIVQLRPSLLANVCLASDPPHC